MTWLSAGHNKSAGAEPGFGAGAAYTIVPSGFALPQIRTTFKLRMDKPIAKNSDRCYVPQDPQRLKLYNSD